MDHVEIALESRSAINDSSLSLLFTVDTLSKSQSHIDIEMHTTERVLSVQSHVSYGYVGGKAATFPLQCLGFDVDIVNTVNFSNHTGYGRFGGSRTSAQDLSTIFNSLIDSDLLRQHRLLTGYIPSGEALIVISDLVKKLKQKNSSLIYLLDPVLGDSGKLYVASDVIPLYKELLPDATVITPNWFEIETLTDTKLSDIDSLRGALSKLHEIYHVPHVVMSSMPLHDFFRQSLPSEFLPADVVSSESEALMKSHLICISSSYNQSSRETGNGSELSVIGGKGNLSTVHAHVLPCIPGYYSGVGDLFSALLLAHYHEDKRYGNDLGAFNLTSGFHTPLSVAASLALSKTVGILRLTHAHVSALPEESSVAGDKTDEERDRLDPERRVRRQRARELRLIQGQDILRTDPVASSTDFTKTAELLELRPWRNFWSTS